MSACEDENPEAQSLSNFPKLADLRLKPHLSEAHTHVLSCPPALHTRRGASPQLQQHR